MSVPLSSDDRKQHQLDILFANMSDNELLPYSAVQALNKQLVTAQKNIIQAINEIMYKLNTNNNTVGNFSNTFNEFVGNPELDLVDWDNLKLIDTNLIKAIYKVYLEIVEARGTYETLKDKIANVGDGGTPSSRIQWITQAEYSELQFNNQLDPNVEYHIVDRPTAYSLQLVGAELRLVINGTTVAACNVSTLLNV